MFETSSRTAHAAAPVLPTAGSLSPLPVEAVAIHSGFWGDRQSLNSRAIIPHSAGWMERLDWVANLERAGAGAKYEHRGREFADSEIYKLIEAISWDKARGVHDQDDILDRLLTTIASAQDPDGYLHTLFGRAWQRPRYSDFQWGHELYCFGHLIQAAVAHHRSTGENRFLQIAIRVADHVCTMFGADGLNRVCGHAEIEVALVELYRVTGDERYLTQAKIFVERRGEGTLPLFEFGQAYWQDDIPVRAASVLRGHAVRALYLAAGAVDVAVETGDQELLDALILQWDNTVARRTYLTGGMGSHHMDEAFGDDFALPPDRSYCETCAGVASIMFSWRLLLATGDAKYADLIERTLYNVIATSPSPDGTAFFYANTLHQRTEHTPPPLNEDGVVIRGGAAGRQAWYEVSCCPPNVARTLSSLGAYIATGSADAVQLHQYSSSRITVDQTTLIVDTDYPRTGAIRVTAESAPHDGVGLALRIPGWATGATFTHNGSTRAAEPGTYATEITLLPGESLTLDLPLDVRVNEPDGRIDAIRGTVAVERGPEVFALESVDLPDGMSFDDVRVTREARYDGGTVQVQISTARQPEGAWPYSGAYPRPATEQTVEVGLVRYHEWAQRGASRMRVWIPVA